MVSILEQKISTNSRLPPSLLTNDDYWEALETHFVNWASETLGLECTAEIETKKNIGAKEATELMTGATSYLVSESGEEQPDGLKFTAPFMTKYAAQRLSEAPEQLDGTSPVFLQLMCETIAKDLIFRLSAWMVDSTDGMAIGDASFITLSGGAFRKTNRYVLIVVNLIQDDEKFPITFVTELEGFLELHKERQRRLRDGEGAGASSSPSLLRSVRRSMIDLEVVIDRMDMTVAECNRLEIGQEIILPSADRGQLNLVAKTIKGDEKIARGELGVLKNFRALKLSTPVSDGFLRNMVEL